MCSACAKWTQELPYVESINVQWDLARMHADQAGRWREDLLNLLSVRDFAGLCDYEIKPERNDDVDALTNAFQTLGFFKKMESLDIGVDKEAVAWAKFQDSEHVCALTNARLTFHTQTDFRLVDQRVSAVLHGAMRKIAKVLGPVPSLEALDFRFGPGAVTTVKAQKASARHKLGARLACSSELANSVSALLAEAGPWCEVHQVEDLVDSWLVDIEIHTGKLQFVPKSAKTYRSIVIEPILNAFAQKGIGTYLKRRLRAAGVDLSDQSINQELARVGSITNELATVDLSSASDTISKGIVACLLPLDWYSFLSRFRTGKVEYQGEVLVLEKFSSMGNAFTFELESLIFWALAKSVVELTVPSSSDAKVASVYGDDIIIPSISVELMETVLTFCGFSINQSKSYTDGPFRESCGADWFLGFEVRPYFQKKLVSGQTLFQLHNFYMRRFEFANAEVVVKHIHPSLRIYGPDGFGDGHLIGTYSPRRNAKIVAKGWDGVTFDTFTLKKRRNFDASKGDSVLPAYSIYCISDSDTPTDHYAVRGTSGYKRISIYTLRRGIFL